MFSFTPWSPHKIGNERQDNWDVYLEATLFSLRSKVHTTPKFKPFKLICGREAVFPSEVPVDMPVGSFELNMGNS